MNILLCNMHSLNIIFMSHNHSEASSSTLLICTSMWHFTALFFFHDDIYLFRLFPFLLLPAHQSFAKIQNPKKPKT